MRSFVFPFRNSRILGAIQYDIGVAEQNITRLYTAINILEDAYVEAHKHLKSITIEDTKARKLLAYILLILGNFRKFL